MIKKTIKDIPKDERATVQRNISKGYDGFAINPKINKAPFGYKASKSPVKKQFNSKKYEKTKNKYFGIGK